MPQLATVTLIAYLAGILCGVVATVVVCLCVGAGRTAEPDTGRRQCRLCGRPAVTTAAGRPVCAECFADYCAEAGKPLAQRPVYLHLLGVPC